MLCRNVVAFSAVHPFKAGGDVIVQIAVIPAETSCMARQTVRGLVLMFILQRGK